MSKVVYDSKVLRWAVRSGTAGVIQIMPHILCDFSVGLLISNTYLLFDSA